MGNFSVNFVEIIIWVCVGGISFDINLGRVRFTLFRNKNMWIDD